jgi:hypothetical protein
VADGDGGGGQAAEGALGREGADEGVDADRVAVAREEVFGGAEDVGADEEAAAGEPERDFVPAGEADDAAGLDGGQQRPVHRDPVAGCDRSGVAAVAIHERRHADDRCFGRERRVEVRRIDGVGEEPSLVQPDRARRSPQELVRMGEPGEAPVLVEAVRLQGAGW